MTRRLPFFGRYFPATMPAPRTVLDAAAEARPPSAARADQLEGSAP